jgi:predicted esterase
MVTPEGNHTHTFILLHGLGSSGSNFGRELLDTAITSSGKKLGELLPFAKFIFPTAKKRRSSAFRRAVLNQWFDIASLKDPSFREGVQYQGLSESAHVILGLIKEESAKVSSKNVILGGLSQGCAIGLAVLLSLDHAIGGFIGISGWMCFQKEILDIASGHTFDDEDNPFAAGEDDGTIEHPIVRAANFQRAILSVDQIELSTEHQTCLMTPVFLGHGEADEKVLCRLGEEASQTVRSVQMDVTWKVYPGQGHWYKIPDEIDDIVDFLRNKTNVVTSG